MLTRPYTGHRGTPRRGVRSGAAALALAFVSACTGDSPNTGETSAGSAPVTGAPLIVYTVNYPLRYFAERIGGRLVDVRFPAPSHLDPALWIPDVETVSAYQGADLFLAGHP